MVRNKHRRNRSDSAAPLNPAHEIIKIDGKLFGLTDVGFELFNISAREFRRRVARRFDQQLHRSAVFQHDRPDHRLRNRDASHYYTVVFQQYRAPLAERVRHSRTRCVRANKIDGVSVAPERLVKQRARLAIAFQSSPGGREGDRIGWMRMDNAIDVRPRLENLGMDIDFAMPARRAGDDVAFQIDGEDILHRDLVESDAVRLHKKQVRIVGQAQRNMAAGKVVVTFGHEHLSGEDKLLFERPMRRPLSCPLRPRRFSVRTFPLDHCPHCPHRPVPLRVQQNREFESSQEKNLEAAPGRGTASMGSTLSSFKWSLPLVSIALSRLAVDCRFSGEIDHPNNGKHDNDRGQTESEHEPDIMPGHALSSLARRYDRASLRVFGRTHGVLLISDADRSLTCNKFVQRFGSARMTNADRSPAIESAQSSLTAARPTNGRRPCAPDPWPSRNVAEFLPSS